LYWAAVVNGVISAPIMVAMMFMSVNPKVIGEFVIGTRLKVLGWVATAVMMAAVTVMLFQLLF
jgi:Mn2+/Fe2+ NRAMP family transporter